MAGESSTVPASRHAPTALERQRIQLDRLLKDPTKVAYIPPPPKEKTVRPPREMMKNVQGSSAGAGSGEFHVYKAGRRREYERLKLLDEAAQKESEQAEFDRRKREGDEAAEAKTAKNRAKRQKKKDRAKEKRTANERDIQTTTEPATDLPLKKRRLINGKEIIFQRSGHFSDEDDSGQDEVNGHDQNQTDLTLGSLSAAEESQTPQLSRSIIIHDD